MWNPRLEPGAGGAWKARERLGLGSRQLWDHVAGVCGFHPNAVPLT